jgi:hypothetical protein
MALGLRPGSPVARRHHEAVCRARFSAQGDQAGWVVLHGLRLSRSSAARQLGPSDLAPRRAPRWLACLDIRRLCQLDRPCDSTRGPPALEPAGLHRGAPSRAPPHNPLRRMRDDDRGARRRRPDRDPRKDQA